MTSLRNDSSDSQRRQRLFHLTPPLGQPTAFLAQA